MKGLILVIDDNPVDVKVTSLTLESQGYACHGFTQHKEGLEWVENNRPTMIFLDLQMPDVSGYDLISLFKAHPNTEKAPIFIISGKNQIEDVKTAIKLGANDYIVKPLDPLVVQEKVRKVDAQMESEFHTVEWGSDMTEGGFFGRPFSIVNISEFGVKLKSPTEIKPGELVELLCLPKEMSGIDKVVARCLCSEQSDTGVFSMQFTFVGMVETQRQVLRKLCRQLWLRGRKVEI